MITILDIPGTLMHDREGTHDGTSKIGNQVIVSANIPGPLPERPGGSRPYVAPDLKISSQAGFATINHGLHNPQP